MTEQPKTTTRNTTSDDRSTSQSIDGGWGGSGGRGSKERGRGKRGEYNCDWNQNPNKNANKKGFKGQSLEKEFADVTLTVDGGSKQV